MKLLSRPPVGGLEFAQLVEALQSRPLALRVRLLKTARKWGVFTEGLLLTKLAHSDYITMQHLYEEYASTSDAFQKAEPLGLGDVLPPRVGPTLETAEYVCKGKNYHLMLLRGDGRELLVEARAFMTLYRRHPSAEWWVSRGKNFYRKPVVLVEDKLFDKGRLLGMLNPVQVGDGAFLSCPPTNGCKVLARRERGKSFFYEPEEE